MKYRMIITALFLIGALVVAPAYAGEAASETQSMKGMETGAKAGAEHMKQMETKAQEHKKSALEASALIDRNIEDQQGNVLGSVHDVVFGQNRNIEYIVLAADDGFKPIPWDMVQNPDLEDITQALVLSIDTETLANAPTFSETEWQAMTQDEITEQVRGYYGTHGEGQHEEMKMKEQKHKEKKY